MFKLNSARDTIYWKRRNNEIVRKKLKWKDEEEKEKEKDKEESIIYNNMEKGDYLVDF